MPRELFHLCLRQRPREIKEAVLEGQSSVKIRDEECKVSESQAVHGVAALSDNGCYGELCREGRRKVGRREGRRVEAMIEASQKLMDFVQCAACFVSKLRRLFFEWNSLDLQMELRNFY
ncbi:hypothetical protein EJB05_27927 [Eragrostis curvula]|uniref:Uncharacterized protein n=1 Tax=Eragrostis curvula TaxID=38414 RepID=A0A5J9UQ76_9POAL|nr:hypothetical protein EJB05_27927 [Eragrostis curvula]